MVPRAGSSKIEEREGTMEVVKPPSRSLILKSWEGATRPGMTRYTYPSISDDIEANNGDS
jgi:hypothetical protein